MKINTAYPYPVLSELNDDYIESFFQTTIHVNKEFGELIVEVNFQLQNAEINTLIKANKCVYTIHIECSQTSFRNSYETNEDRIRISLPTDRLRGKINIHSFIVANQEISNYTNTLLNDWFKSVPVTYEKGNLIAIGGAIETILYEDDMELLNLPSIVNIVRSNKNEYMEVETNQDLLSISLPTAEYDQYAKHANSLFKHTILSTVIVPALVYVFSKMNESDGDYEEYTWYQVLQKIFAENNLRIEDVGTDALSGLEAAQRILRNPLKSSFEEIEKLNKMRD